MWILGWVLRPAFAVVDWWRGRHVMGGRVQTVDSSRYLMAVRDRHVAELLARIEERKKVRHGGTEDAETPSSPSPTKE
jgi:hypothetical protein